MEPAVDLDSKWLVILMKQQYQNEKPVEVDEVRVERAVPAGENYTSLVLRVKIRTTTASGIKKALSMIVKLARTSEESQKVLKELSAFRNETKMFTTVFSQMEDLMNECEDKRDTLWAKWYGGTPYTSMALEDLKDIGYSMIDRKNWQDLDHSLLVLRNIGRFHAMSKVLLQRGLISSEDDKGHYFLGPNASMKTAFVNSGFHMIAKAMKNKIGSWPAGWEKLADWLGKIKPLLCDKLTELYENYDKRFEILCHGDLWSSNMLFKHMEYTGLPIAVKFVDYQITHVNSFIWDVIYFLHTSVKPSIRRAHKADLLNAYHESFSGNLKFFKYPGYIPTLDDVIKEEIRLVPASLTFLLTFMPIMVASINDGLDFDKMVDGTPEEMYKMEIFTEEKFVREVGEDIEEFSRLNLV